MKRVPRHKLALTIAGLVMAASLCGQQGDGFPRDTSFSVRSEYKKIEKDFPQAYPVEEFTDLKIHSARDVVYLAEGSRELHMDIFWPKGPPGKAYPVVICLHGGGWASGDKSHLVPLAQQLAGQGYIAAAVEYRLSPEAKYPAGVTDAKAAIRWLRENAGQYHIDTTKVAILGTSAGATIASLVGNTPGNSLYPAEGSCPKVSDRVQAIVNIDGVLDFTDPAESGKDTDPGKPSAAARWFGGTYQENPDLWVEASPLTYAGEQSPPTLFINSALPRFHAGRDQYIEVLEKEGTYTEVHTLPDTPHPFWLFHPWFDETIPMVLDFLGIVFR